MPPTMTAEKYRRVAFLVLQLLVVFATFGLADAHFDRERETQRLPISRRNPVAVKPLHDIPGIVSDEQLRAVLSKLTPQFRNKKPKINYVDHAMRMWGAEATFADPNCLSGEELRKLLLNHETFASYWGKEAAPLLIDGPEGVRIRTREGNSSASHTDHTLASQGEIGTPLDYAVTTPERSARLLNVLQQSLRDFDLNQGEYEWSALAYALYLPHAEEWQAVGGQRITYDLMARRIMRQELPHGVCFGNHRVHALVMMLRIDAEFHLFSPEMKREVCEYLHALTRQIVGTQSPEGYWDGTWPGVKTAGSNGEKLPSGPLSARLLATGHILEWWALAPEEYHPPREVLIRAGQWLCRTIEEMSPAQIEVNYTFLTHAGRALALWRGKFPADVPLGR